MDRNELKRMIEEVEKEDPMKNYTISADEITREMGVVGRLWEKASTSDKYTLQRFLKCIEELGEFIEVCETIFNSNDGLLNPALSIPTNKIALLEESVDLFLTTYDIFTNILHPFDNDKNIMRLFYDAQCSRFIYCDKKSEREILRRLNMAFRRIIKSANENLTILTKQKLEDALTDMMCISLYIARVYASVDANIFYFVCGVKINRGVQRLEAISGDKKIEYDESC